MAPLLDKTILLLLTLLLPLYAIVIMLMGNAKWRIAAKSAFFILLIFELAWGANTTLNHRNALTSKEFNSKTGYNDYTIDAIDYLKSMDRSFFRVQKEYVGQPAVYINMNDSQYQNFHGTPSYNSFNQKYYIRFLAGADLLDPTKEWQTRCARGVSGCPAMQSFASVKYSLEKTPRSKFERFGYVFKRKIGDVYIYANPRALPFGFTCDKFMTESDYSNLDERQKAFAMLKVFTVANEEVPKLESLRRLNVGDIPKRYKATEYEKDIEALREHHLNITSFSPKRITGTVSVPNDRMLIFTTPFDKGWRARLDERATQIILVDYGLVGILMPKGEHTIELSYHLPYIASGLAISLAVLAIYILLLASVILRIIRCPHSGQLKGRFD
jgi:uncharacterized membrane protein YfhO